MYHTFRQFALLRKIYTLETTGGKFPFMNGCVFLCGDCCGFRFHIMIHSCISTNRDISSYNIYIVFITLIKVLG